MYICVYTVYNTMRHDYQSLCFSLLMIFMINTINGVSLTTKFEDELHRAKLETVFKVFGIQGGYLYLS